MIHKHCTQKLRIPKRTARRSRAATQANDFKEVFLTSALLILVFTPRKRPTLLPLGPSAAETPLPPGHPARESVPADPRLQARIRTYVLAQALTASDRTLIFLRPPFPFM